MSAATSALSAHLDSVHISSVRPALSREVLPTLIGCIGVIAQQLRSAAQVAAVGSSNAFGDEQLNVDVLAEKTIREEIRKCASIVTASSEEDPEERAVHAADRGTSEKPSSPETYTIAFDPLDGSSIIAPNWTVGTIIGIWDGPTALRAAPSEKLVAAILGVFGPRTTAIVAIRAAGVTPICFELGFDPSGRPATSSVLVRPTIQMLAPPFTTRYFAPANLRAAAEDEKYAGLVNHYIRSKYTLRYSGGLVPDVVHALVKGHGVYVSPVTAASKAKLRRLYELAPVALVMECAGARAMDPQTGGDVLATAIEDCDERAGLVCGTAEEVAFVREALGLP